MTQDEKPQVREFTLYVDDRGYCRGFSHKSLEANETIRVVEASRLTAAEEALEKEQEYSAAVVRDRKFMAECNQSLNKELDELRPALTKAQAENVGLKQAFNELLKTSQELIDERTQLRSELAQARKDHDQDILNLVDARAELKREEAERVEAVKLYESMQSQYNDMLMLLEEFANRYVDGVYSIPKEAKAELERLKKHEK